MPVEFLTPAQEAQYGHFTTTPTAAQLAQYFWLDEADREIIDRHRGAHNRWGFALQLTTVRFLGTFLADPIAVPPNVLRYVAQQLQVAPDTLLTPYATSRMHKAHTAEIRQLYGYRTFTDQPGHFRFVRWLYERAWLTTDRPSVLFDAATAHCVEHKILLPGVTVLTRLVAQVRERAALRLWRNLARLPTADQRESLEQLLRGDPHTYHTGLDRLRQAPTTVSAPGLLKAVQRAEALRAFGAHQWAFGSIPLGRIQLLARYAAQARAQIIARMGADRRHATLVAFVIVFTTRAQDDVGELFERFLTDLFARMHRQNQQGRLRTLRDLDDAARQLRTACLALLEDPRASGADAATLREHVLAIVPEATLRTAMHTVDRLTQPPDQTMALASLLHYYAAIRRFLPALMNAFPLEATPAGQSVVAAWHYCV